MTVLNRQFLFCNGSYHIGHFFPVKVLILVMALSKAAYAVEVTINPGKYSDYYHIPYSLDPGKYQVNKAYGFNDGGQFEVLVPKEYFPVPAPNCRKNIIVRMPWSEHEEKKKALYEELLSASKPVPVILELNPCVRVLQDQPLSLELTYCNVFFRHRNGDYFNHL